jgi:capsular exopolysaccharide synthesis family protein
LEELPPGLPKEDQLNELLQAWSSAREKRMQMAGRYREVHPDYLEAEKAEARLKEQLDQFIELSTKAVENEIDLLEKEIEQKDDRAEALKAEAIVLEREIEAGLQKLERLGSERDVANSSYQAMLSRVAEARLAADEDMVFTEVIRDAKVPRFPVSPRKPKAIFTGVFVGGMLASFIVLALAFLLDTINAVNDLRTFNLNVLGSIPSQKKIESRGELATIGLHDKYNHIVEIFTGINALLSSDKLLDHAKVLVVGSVMPGEGKTVCVCNLAISSALSGAKTLLVDADLRRPQIAKIFALDESQPSLSDWLKKGTDEPNCQHLVFDGVVDNLDVISCQPFGDENPAEFMGRDRLAVLLDWARDKYDRVIIDSPPMGMVGDAYVLMSAAVSVILVSRIGKTRRRLLKHVMNRLSAMDVHMLGCIANDVPHSLAGMFGGTEGYGYGYGYRYKSYKND